MTNLRDKRSDRVPRHDLGYCQLSFCPDAALVSTIRRFVSAMYSRLISDRDGVDRVALAVHELLENAVKYAQGGDTGLWVEVFEEGGRLIVSVTTRNQANGRNAAVLREMLEELNQGKDPIEAYQDAMRRSLRDNDSSRLGLARLRAEAGMTLAVEEGPNGTLALVATTEITLDSTP